MPERRRRALLLIWSFMMPQPLIPRRTLFDNPVAFGGQISPCGRWFSWLAPVDGVMNIWLAAADQPGKGEPLTRTKGRPINWQGWTPDSRFVMFVNDETGDENWNLFAVDPTTKELRNLTPLKGVSAQPKSWSRDVPGKLVVGLNDRDQRWHDLYLVDIATGARDLLWLNTQEFLNIGLDWSLTPRHARTTLPDGGGRMWRIEGTTATRWFDIEHQDALNTGPSYFDGSNKRLLMYTSVGRNTTALAWVDWQSGKETIVVEHPRYDVASTVSHPVTRELEAVSVDGARAEWVYVAPSIADDFAFLRTRLDGFEVNVGSKTDDNRRWVVNAHRAEQPLTCFLFDRDKQTVTELFQARPALKSSRLAPMRPIEAKARDGLDLVSYLTLPADVTGDKPAKPLPMVLVVHGGPWSRDAYGYRGDHQWLANRGYGVLSVNYRGSTGFGKGFIAASEKQHGAKMHDDLIDMVGWAIEHGIADKDKVAIFGGSYGGLASFYGATFTPDVFCCSVPVVGITNLQTLLESMPPYWAGFAEFMYRSYGDPRTEEGRKLLAERSPISKVDNIKKPMLIFHGANDVRCKVAESDSIVAAMQKKGIPVTYVVYPDEGHGFQKPANRLAYYAMAEAFFARHLGGACEPVGTDFEGSSHEVRAGAESLKALGVG